MKYALTGLAAAVALAGIALAPAMADAGWRGGWGGGGARASAFISARGPIIATIDTVTVIAPITAMTGTLTAMGPVGITAGIKPREAASRGAMRGRATHEGNLVYRKDRAEFQSGDGDGRRKITVAEVEHLVQPGEIEPDHVSNARHFRQALSFCSTTRPKADEDRTTRKRA